MNTINCLEKCVIFDDLYDITENMDSKDKGDIFELITYYLFRLCPTLNGDLDDIWLYKDIPFAIIKELKLPSKDKCIVFQKIENLKVINI